MKKKRILSLKTALAVSVLCMMITVLSYAQDDGARGIYYDSKAKKLGAKFYVSLVRGEKSVNVPTTYPFKTGDRVKFNVEANQDCYIYILNRTFLGDPNKIFENRDRGIVLDEDKVTNDTKYTVLFPSRVAGTENFLKKNKKYTMPMSKKASFVFDEEIGVERLYVVISKSKNVQLDKILGEDEKIGVEEPTEEKLSQQDQEVLNQLMKSLKAGSMTQYGKNEKDFEGFSVEGSKGIENNASTKAVLIVVNLEHK